MKNYLKFAESELTIYCGASAGANCGESLRQAEAIAAGNPKENVLYLNTFLSLRKLNAKMKQFISSYPENLQFRMVEIGELSEALGEIRQFVMEQKITCLIINSWEFAHHNYGFKEKALFALMKMVNKLGITLLIYSQAKPVDAGKIQRAGLGKLSAFADAIIKLEAPEEENTSIESPQTPKRPYSQTPAPEKLDALKINELEYARSQSGISSGGELILPVEEEVEEDVYEEGMMEV